MQYQSLFFEHFSKCPVPVVVIWAVRTAFKDTAKIYNVFQCLFVVLLSCSARKNNNKNLSSNVRRCHFQLLVNNNNDNDNNNNTCLPMGVKSLIS